jgi:hypothetical protein
MVRGEPSAAVVASLGEVLPPATDELLARRYSTTTATSRSWR